MGPVIVVEPDGVANEVEQVTRARERGAREQVRLEDRAAREIARIKERASRDVAREDAERNRAASRWVRQEAGARRARR